jgi:hypothetical protein
MLPRPSSAGCQEILIMERQKLESKKEDLIIQTSKSEDEKGKERRSCCPALYK